MTNRVSKLLATAAISLAVALPAAASAQTIGIDGDPQVAFIYISPVGDMGWTWAHDQSRQRLEEALGTDVAFTESIPEVTERVRQVIDRYVGRGYNVIIGTAFGYSDAFLEAAEAYPDVVFMNAAGYTTADNLASYYGRSFESMYLAGMAAGYATETDKLGFVAAYPLGLVLWNANAFALGAQSVNPDVEILTSFTNTWFDPVLEQATAEALIEQGVDVIGQHQDTPGPQIAAEQAGIHSVGFNADMSSSAPTAHLMAATWDWADFVIPMVEGAVAGNFEGGSYFEGLDSGVVDISAFTSDVLTEEMRSAILAARQDIETGTLDMWAGPIYDQNGDIVVPEGETLSVGDLFGMDFLVQGVVGTLPN